MMTDPGSPRSASGRHASDDDLDELARARARISDLEAALEVAQRQAAVPHDMDARARSALARSEARFRKLIDNLHVGVVVQGPKSEILLVNERAIELLGLSEDELHGRSSFDPRWEVIREDGSPYLPQERPVAVVLTTHAPVRGAVMGIKRPRTADLVWLHVNALPEFDEHGQIVQVVATLDDITQRKQLSDSLRETSKLDSLGLLAGGIAHDFNNLLTVITSCTELVHMQLEPGTEMANDLEEVLTAADRAAGLTRQLLSFARRQIGTPRRVDLCEVTTSFRKLLDRLLSDHHELEIQHEPGPVTVKIDQGQLEQVLVNLVVNARDAMPGGGRVRIDVARVGPGHAPEPLAERAAALLSVRDQGVGMPPEVRPRVFEPFFTTKEPGRGTGLGLATVLGIVRQAGGVIHVDSEPGKGTTMQVFLPLLAEPAEPALSRRVTGLGRGEQVLVVDDDDVLRSVAARMLAELGYQASEARDGFEALDLLEQREGEFELIITDLVMPRMGGLELAQRVRQRWPEIRVLGCSGHTNLLDDSDVLDGALSKPFTMATLSRSVRGVLGG
jgi:PAS domain S-box-containing protein